MSRRLLVFELRGTLLDKLHSSQTPSTRTPDFSFGTQRIFLRPHATSVLQALSKEYDMAVWSSAQRKNVLPLVPFLGQVPWKFVWTRELTEPDEYRRSVAVHDDDTWAVIKNLDLVRRNFPEYSPQSTVAVDDNAAKYRGNSDALIVLPAFDVLVSEGDEALVRLQAALLENNACTLESMPLFL